jgi:glycosyltransferase involved in cell wall biosynthesis
VRIARVLTRLNLGGPARQALACDPLLVERGHQVRIFCGSSEPGEGDLFETFCARGIDVVRVEGLGRGVSWRDDLRAWRRLRSELRSFAPDLLHTHASKAGALGRLALPRARAARVHTFHGHVLEGYFSRPTSLLLRLFERRLARGTDRTLAVSRATAKDLLRLRIAPEERLAVVPPGVDLEPLLSIEGEKGGLRREIGASEGDFLVGVIGRLAEVKCPERAVDVLDMLASSHPPFRLLFVGDGGEREPLERRIAALPAEVRERVTLLGARESMTEVLSGLDCVLSCSRTEGMPVALIEAAAAGLPVVATDVGGVGEVVTEGRGGFLASDTAGLARGLKALLEDRDLAVEMGRNARAEVREKHGAKQLADRLEQVYEGVLEERRCDC